MQSSSVVLQAFRISFSVCLFVLFSFKNSGRVINIIHMCLMSSDSLQFSTIAKFYFYCSLHEVIYCKTILKMLEIPCYSNFTFHMSLQKFNKNVTYKLYKMLPSQHFNVRSTLFQRCGSKLK